MHYSALKRQLKAEAFRGRSTKLFWPRVLYILAFSMDGPAAVATFRLAQFFQRKGLRPISQLFRRRLEQRFGCYINPKVEIGDGLRLAHPVGIVIGNGANIGKDCSIYQHVAIGGKHAQDWHAGLHPTIGDGVLLSAGTKVIGTVTVGNGVIVGANAVVTKDVPANHTAVGIPARNIRRNDVEMVE